jgi:predicted O-linked N-acetylglucosamine transferase (SPINDLY family)
LRKRQQRWDDAVAAFERAVELNGAFTDALYNLGNAYHAKQRYAEAAAVLRRAVDSQPDHADALAALGETLRAMGRYDEAAPVLRKAIQLHPGDAQLLCSLAAVFEAQREFADAAECYRAALEIDPARYETQHNLGHCFFELGRSDEALDCFRKAEEGPSKALPRAMLAVMIPGAPKATNEDVLVAREAFAADMPAVEALHTSLPQGDSARIRIGYISSFFHRQNWMKPVWSLIAQHDRDQFELHLFSDAHESAMPEGYSADARDRYHDISKQSNREAAALMAAQKIDLLIDLNGYSKLHRLPLFTLRPAPVIVGWFNMFATTGMDCYDYLIGDEQVIPPEEERFYCEKIIRVEGSYLTFDVSYPVPEIVEPPCVQSGRIAFGCLAPLYKITPQAMAAWAEILQAARGSSLVLRGSALQSSGARRYLTDAFAAHGIAAERLRLHGPAPHHQFLETYNEIDIALDTFPYNGGTTTTEAIWQGVPVIAFHGDRWVSRTSASILHAGGLSEFINRDLESYIRQAIRLAQDPSTPKRLAGLRRNMRSRLRSSPVCDTPGFARRMEAIYRRLLDRA